MAALTGYFDDSRTDGLILSLAGYVGDESQWAVFEDEWAKVLARFEVPYFHMNEFCDPNGPYKKWLPPQEHKKEIAAFLAGLVRAIGRSRLWSFGSIVRMRDVERFNADYGQSIEAYSLAAYSNMLSIGQKFPQAVVSAVFDHIEQASSKLKRATIYGENDSYHQAVTAKIQPIPLNKVLTFKDVPAIQAADFPAWELRKHHLKQNEWWERGTRPDDVTKALIDLMEWQQAKFGAQLPARKSLEALLEEMPIDGIVWDYKVLCQAHEARGGVWA